MSKQENKFILIGQSNYGVVEFGFTKGEITEDYTCKDEYQQILDTFIVDLKKHLNENKEEQ